MSVFSPFNGVIHWARFGISSTVLAMRSDSTVENSKNNIPPPHGELPEHDGSPIVFTAADPTYFNEHGPGLVESLTRVCSDVRLHIHIMQDTEKEHGNTLERIKELACSTKLTVSFEYCDPGSNWMHRRAQFFQIRRFLRLAELIETTNATILAVDIDVVFSRSPTIAISEWPQHDLMLQVNLGPLRPTPLTCACMIIRPTPATQSIFRAAVTEMLRHHRHGTYVDHLDERCLAHAIKGHGNMKLVALPDNFCTSKYDGETIFDGAGNAKPRLAERLDLIRRIAPRTSNAGEFRERCMTGSLSEIRHRKSWSKAALMNLLNEIRGKG